MLFRQTIDSLVVAACVLVGTEQVSAGTYVFSDHEYPNANWIVPDMTDVKSVGQVLTGGNPGSYRQISMLGAQDGVIAANLNSTFHWNPSQQGQLTQIVYNVDTKAINNVNAEYFPLLQQSGVLYMNLNPLSQLIGVGNGWYSSGDSNLYFHSFVVLDPHPGHGFTQGQSGTPDFSTNGSEILFGYAVTVGSSGGSITSVTGIDNDPITLTFAPTVTPVPEPSTVVLLGFGIGALLVMRRKLRVARTAKMSRPPVVR